MEIRFFEIGDIKECVELFIHTVKLPPWNEIWSEMNAEKYLREFVDSPRFAGFCLFDCNMLIGVSFCHEKTWLDSNERYIDEIFIAPEYQGKGFGRALLKFIEDDAAQKSVDSITLVTRKDIPAHQFYLANSFEDSARTTFMFKNI